MGNIKLDKATAVYPLMGRSCKTASNQPEIEVFGIEEPEVIEEEEAPIEEIPEEEVPVEEIPEEEAPIEEEEEKTIFDRIADWIISVFTYRRRGE